MSIEFSNVEQRVVSLEGEQKVYFVRGPHRQFQGRLYGVLCSRGGLLLGGGPTLSNLGNDRAFISNV